VKRLAKGGGEQDAFHARRFYCYLQRAGVARKIKRQSNRRERREATREAEWQRYDG
jgi:hypothetical protein